MSRRRQTGTHQDDGGNTHNPEYVVLILHASTAGERQAHPREDFMGVTEDQAIDLLETPGATWGGEGTPPTR